MIDPTIVLLATAVVQALSTICLVGVTVYYAYQAKQNADASKEMATETGRSSKATGKMALEMQEQRIKYERKARVFYLVKASYHYENQNDQIREIATMLECDPEIVLALLQELQLEEKVDEGEDLKWRVKQPLDEN